MTYQLTFSRRQAQQGRHGFEVTAESESLLKAILQARYSKSYLKSVYLLRTPTMGRQHYQRIELRRGGGAEIMETRTTASHTAGIPSPPPPAPALPAATPGTAAQAAASPPEQSCLNPPPGSSRRRPGKHFARVRKARSQGRRQRVLVAPTQKVTLEVGRCTVTLVPHRAVVDRMEETFGVELPQGPAWWEWHVVTSDRQQGLLRQGSARTFMEARGAARKAARDLEAVLSGREAKRAWR